MFLFSCIALTIALGCSSDTTQQTDAATPQQDAAKDTAPSSPCGALPAITCRPGADGKACDLVSKPLQCLPNATQWTCPSGTVSADKCGCNTQGTSLQPGDPCGVKDAAAE